ncbi:hypothetical protein JCM5296_000334 [Sporobolomyces johnsonii]
MTSFPPFYTTPATLTKDNWRAKVADKKSAQAALIPEEWRLSPELLSDQRLDVTGVPAECGILTAKELEITELDEVEELASRLAKGAYKAVEVITAFCKRAAVAQQLTNCLTELFFDHALERAKELDEILKATGKPVGPLHGVPISLKDQFDIAGTELTMGYVSYLGRISERDSALVRLLLDAGAIIHVRTNVPQTLMIGDTVNHLFGRTHNPLNRKLSPGGSSGGEGALIAMKGSILGVGTDIGGSVRIPSSFCGLHTIRPTTRRVPYGHATNSLLGQESVLSVAGPMSRSLSSCTYFLKTVLDANPSNYDASSLPFPFNDAVYSQAKGHKKLAFGIMRTDYNVTPTPPIKRALETAAAKLVEAGHEVIEFDMAEFKGAFLLAKSFFAADGGEDFKRTLAAIEEPLIPGLSIAPDAIKTTYEVWQLNRQKEALQQAFLTKWLATAGQTSTGRSIDGLLCPVAPVTACIPGGNPWAGYTGMFNLLDAPAVVFPVTKVDPTVDVKPSTFAPLSELDQQFYDAYDPNVTAGMPASVQIVGKRWRDEELLGIGEAAAKVIAPFPDAHWHGFPKGEHTCSVTAFANSSLALAEYTTLHPAANRTNRHPVIVFLVRHEPTGKLALFDMGLGKNWLDYVPADQREWHEQTYQCEVEHNFDETLAKVGVKGEDVNFIVISHEHFDHAGHSLTPFPNAKVLIGPNQLKGTTALHSPTPHTNVEELSWHHSPTMVAAFEHSYDVFDDGSFLLVATPGHTVGHLSALVRTGADEYVVLAADCCHHPQLLSLAPQDAHFRIGLWREKDEPLDKPPQHSMHEDYDLTEATLERIKACEKRLEFLVVLAHDFKRWDKWAEFRDKETGGVQLEGWRKRGLKYK